jgi:protein ImuB
MLHTHLENFKSDHPIVAVSLSAEPSRPVAQQFGLFETALRNPHQLYETLARLTALLGNDRVGTPVIEETHRPDTFRMEQFVWNGGMTAVSSQNSRDTTARVPPALRRFRPPARTSVFVSDQRYLESDKVRGQIIDQVGPFLLSGNWWDEKAWARAEHDFLLENGPTSSDYGVTGEVLVRAHEAEGMWKLDGIYD